MSAGGEKSMRSLCIVMRTANYRENDKMLSLFSRDSGRIDALARGCRKDTSSLLSSTDVFCCADFSFTISKDRYYVTQAELKNSFFGLRKNMSSLLTAMVLIEIAEKIVMPHEGNPRLFALLASALHALSNGEDSDKVLIFFSFKLLDNQGMRPVTDECTVCGRAPADRLSILSGGTVCDEHDGIDVPHFYIESIRKILETPSKDLMTCRFEYDKVLAKLSLDWVRTAFDLELKSAELVK
ncbi:MAG: DNA repair protein RecO [Clostridia bacterium]|jgi:DNA repair protein RecO (recombination protein O)|nr:DNA repair protein RecO [Clostridia bacterium]MBQ4455983.1 DNA repair protein RecO [Clostridia bacterium]MBQ5957019.1 DNA repair protein RecO [Clostridia bacterium]MBR3564586.1 DNA repair protein RecO [Clostridia bacterium]MBR6135188.1 DNA repair protein RecO [Clostridia bacterium]